MMMNSKLAPQVDDMEVAVDRTLVDQDEDLVIAVRDVSKVYRLYDRPQDRLKQALLWRLGRSYGKDFHALSHVTFNVHRGEAMAIIGQNGSGKSTLLQIIAGTLQPTTGQIAVNGRVAALLELGSGFNPEYSGRENVFLSGSILGLSQAQMEDKFDEIAAFADIGEFINQPVKLYSSGMMVRLAFAVQAHLDPEVLIVDEALAVGDVYFQHKCMRLLKQRLDMGLTMLFVSHDTETVKRFCRTALWLDRGEARFLGSSGAAAEQYLAFMRMRDAQPQDADSGFLKPQQAIDTLANTKLVEVHGEIDVHNRELVLRGKWMLRDTSLGTVSLETADHRGKIGFRFHGSQLELVFERSPQAFLVRVLIDGVERIVDCTGPGDRGLERTLFTLEQGWHWIVIEPAFDQLDGMLAWRGGHVIDVAPLSLSKHALVPAPGSDVPAYGNGKAHFIQVELLDYHTLEPITETRMGQRVRLRLFARRVAPAGPRLEFSFIVRDKNRIDLFGTTTIDEGIRLDPNATDFAVEFAFTIRLGPGSYSILASFVECSEDLTTRVPLEQIDIAAVFQVRFNQERPVWYLFNEPVAVRATAAYGQPE